MYKIPANTLFLGKNLVFVPECHSTNTLAQEIIDKAPSTVEGTTVITDKQTAGRGQRGNSWQSGEGENITLSVILKPSFLSAKDQFFLTIVTSLAVKQLVDDLTPTFANIKWPNDIIVNDKKIAGILIENQVLGSQITTTIVGIGLNVNHEVFGSMQATSIKLVAKKHFNLEQVIHQLLANLESLYLKLKSGQFSELRSRYLSALYRRNILTEFKTQSENFSGVIDGVDDHGRLAVFVGGNRKIFDLKEIAMVMDADTKI